MKLGKFQINVFVENRSHVDGGMMFGVIPKTLWAKNIEVSADNLIAMDTNIFVIRTGEKTLVVDTGLGDMLDDKQKKMYGITQPSNMNKGLADLGLAPKDINYVIQTHLHLDHVGGAVVDNGHGKPIPRFPNAIYIAQKIEWNAANNPDVRSYAAYDKTKFMPLLEHGQLKLIDGNTDLLPGIKLVLTGGHTLGHQGVIVESEGERLLLFADIVPMTNHLRPAYVSSADLFPLDTIKIKKELMPELAKHGWYLGFDHDPEIKIARIIDTGKKLVAEKIEV
jgi:glyoxylase-like metal-dependent hydrolase (beta-lactamase superfamily II)